MIRLSKDHVLEDFFIDDNGIITNKEGEVQKPYYISGRPHFKKIAVHKIQMWTKYDWRDTKIWVIHHKDENPLNNSIDNLVFMTFSEHSSLHSKGRKLDEETKKKLSEAKKGIKRDEETKSKISKTLKEKCKDGWVSTFKGKKLTEEHKKKISNYSEKSRWFNDGVYTYFIPPEEALPHYQKGRLICKK